MRLTLPMLKLEATVFTQFAISTDDSFSGTVANQQSSKFEKNASRDQRALANGTPVFPSGCPGNVSV